MPSPLEMTSSTAPFFAIAFTAFHCLHLILGLENGLARTPPMGWLSWTRFLCDVNCRDHPKSCISESLFMEMGSVMAEEGYRDAGYTRVNVDDCWALKTRGDDGRLRPNLHRFPSGIPHLAHHMHSLGLQLGMYSNYGRKTCMGFAGTELDDMELDAVTFAEWGADMLKLDGCFRQPTDFHIAYPKMSAALNKTKRPIVFSCSWPYYVRAVAHKEPDYALVSRHCNLWRNFDDIAISWASIAAIIEFYDEHQDTLAAFHGPGRWNDPDMLIIGNPGISLAQARTQMALCAPLLMSNDLRDIETAFQLILLNHRLIAVNQDPLGIMGKRVRKEGRVAYYVKPMTPSLALEGGVVDYSYAIVVHNKDTVSMNHVKFTLKSLGIVREKGFSVQELFTGEDIGPMSTDQEFSVSIGPCDSAMYAVRILTSGSLRLPGITHTHLVHGGYARLYLALIILICLAFSFRKRRCLSLCRWR